VVVVVVTYLYSKSRQKALPAYNRLGLKWLIVNNNLAYYVLDSNLQEMSR
jgi:hypothetical protein